MLKTIIVIFLVIAAAILAGCVSQDEPAVPAPVQQTNAPVSMTPRTTVTAPVSHSVTTLAVTTTKPPARIFNGEYRWAEYRINNTITLPPNPRYQWEYVAKIERSSETYAGVPAVHEKITVTGEKSFHATDNSFYERSTKRFLGGTSSGSGDGMEPYDQTLPGDETYREDRNWGWLLISPFEEMDTPLTDEGRESVTVPAGTYPDARKYSGKFHSLQDYPITFWVSGDVPVPVQYRIVNPELDGEDPVQTFELKGWG